MSQDTEVVYTFRAEDGISAPMRKAEEQLLKTAEATAQAERSSDSAKAAMDSAAQSAENVAQKEQTAILKSVETLAAMHALQSGVGAIASSVKTLGLVADETYATLQKLTAGIQLVVGTAEAVKGVVTLFNTLNSVLKTTAIVSTFAAIAENPAVGLAAVAGAGVAAGAIGGYMMSTTKNVTNTTINVQHESTARTTSAAVDAGAWY